MSQKRNSVQLNATAIARLQKLVDSGEFCSLDDAASHIIVTVLSSTYEYLPVLTKNEPKLTQVNPVLTQSTHKTVTSIPNHDKLTTVQEASTNKQNTVDFVSLISNA